MTTPTPGSRAKKHPWNNDKEAVTSLFGYWDDCGKAPQDLIDYALSKGWIKKTGKSHYDWTPKGDAFLEKSQ